MGSILTNQPLSAARERKHASEVFLFPKGEAAIYVSTLFEIGDSDQPHFHDEPHLAFILNGGLLDKRRASENERESGALAFFHAGERHQTITKTFPTKYVSLQFETDYFRRNPHIENRLQTSLRNSLNAKFLMLKIYSEMRAADEFSPDSLEMLLQALLAGEAAGEKKRPGWLERIVEQLNDRWNEELSLIELARAADVHPKTVSKYFPRFFRCTLGEYRRRLRIEKSLSLIKNSKLPLTAIAYECGFYDQSHFTATFKNLTGFLPKQFQRL